MKRRLKVGCSLEQGQNEKKLVLVEQYTYSRVLNRNFIAQNSQLQNQISLNLPGVRNIVT